MVDVHSKNTRSFNMSKIRSKNTAPELLVRKHLYHQGFRYRINVKSLPGTPDIVLYKYNTIIFVHGCFWHGHEECRKSALPKTRTEWWKNKITRNKIHDSDIRQKLQNQGWNILIIWECELTSKLVVKTLNEIVQYLHNSMDKSRKQKR
ncbi:very short patch repair endonuclease [Phocaeicola sp.]